MGASLLILANKRDLPNCISLQDIEKARLPYILIDLGIITECDSDSSVKIFPCSAITGENVQEGISWLVQDIGDKRYHFD